MSLGAWLLLGLGVSALATLVVVAAAVAANRTAGWLLHD